MRTISVSQSPNHQPTHPSAPRKLRFPLPRPRAHYLFYPERRQEVVSTQRHFTDCVTGSWQAEFLLGLGYSLGLSQMMTTINTTSSASFVTDNHSGPMRSATSPHSAYQAFCAQASEPFEWQLAALASGCLSFLDGWIPCSPYTKSFQPELPCPQGSCF